MFRGLALLKSHHLQALSCIVGIIPAYEFINRGDYIGAGITAVTMSSCIYNHLSRDSVKNFSFKYKGVLYRNKRKTRLAKYVASGSLLILIGYIGYITPDGKDLRSIISMYISSAFWILAEITSDRLTSGRYIPEFMTFSYIIRSS